MEEDIDILDGSISASEDEDADDERKHIQLVDAISAMDGKRQKLGQRTVPSTQVSEYHFGSISDGDKVQLKELLGTLNSSVSHGDVKKQLRCVTNEGVVSVPLPKHEKLQIERTVAYESTSKEVAKWDKVVEQNRLADQLRYPLESQEVRLFTTDQFVKRFTPRTPLEMQVAALLQGSDNVTSTERELTKAEERALQAMDLEEARERRRELMKHRALLSYKEAKAKWQKKIKSKRFHRVLKKEKQKTEKKNLENLQKTDPEAFTDKMKELEKERIEERMSLKHRGGSKYAQKKMIYAKYDDKARKEVQDMLQKSRELTKKVAVDDSDGESEGGVSLDSEDEEKMLVSEAMTATDSNPWLTTTSRKQKKEKNPWMSSNIQETQKMYSRPEEVVNREIDKREMSDDPLKVKSSLVESVEKEKDKNAELDTENGKATQASAVIDSIFEKAKEKRKKKEKEKASKKNALKKRAKKIAEARKAKKARGKKSDNGKEKKKKSENGETDSKNDSETEINVIGIGDDDEEEEEVIISEGLSRKRTLDDVGNLSDYSSEEETLVKKVKKQTSETAEGKEKPEKEKQNKEEFIDPNKMFTLESKIQRETKMPDVLVENSDSEEEADQEEEQRMTIAEAFADDDVVEEFSREKKEIIEEETPKDIDLNLPGWGQWGGTGIVPTKHKRFIIKAPPSKKRADLKLGHVIINEKKPELTKHQVKVLPFPYLNVRQFEQSVRAPIGKTWNPETAFKELTKPKVITKLGKIIDPINKTRTFEKKRKEKTDMELEAKKESHVKPQKNRKRKFKGKKKQK